MEPQRKISARKPPPNSPPPPPPSSVPQRPSPQVALKPQGSPTLNRAKPPVPPHKPSPPSAKRGLPLSGKPPLPASKPISRDDRAGSGRKPPPSGAPPPPPPGSRPQLMKQSSSFTTEDMDLFGKKRKGSSSDSSPNLSSIRRSRKDGEDHSPASRADQKDKRRSKSVGAFARIGSRTQLPGPKPKVPVKPKFTDQLITGKGLPEVATEASGAHQTANTSVNQNIPLNNIANSSQLQHNKQHSLVSNSALTDETLDQKKPRGDVHPTKLTVTNLTVKEPDSPSHSEVDKNTGKKHPNGQKTDKTNGKFQRKGSLSLSDIINEKKASVTSRIKRKFSRSDADTVDHGTTTRRHVGKATFYNSESSDQKSDDAFDSSSSGSEQGVKVEKQNSVSSSTFYVGEENPVTVTGDSKSAAEVQLPSVSIKKHTKAKHPKESIPSQTTTQVLSAASGKTDSDMTSRARDTGVRPDNDDDENVYEPFEFPGSQEVYENAEFVSEHQQSKKLLAVPTIQVEGDQSSSDQNSPYLTSSGGDYLPMNVSRGEVYENVDKSSGILPGNNTLSSDTYDNAEFKTEMYDNSLYEKRNTDSMYEAIQFHRARELREISRRSRFRKTAKKQKMVLLEDDLYEPVSDKQAQEELSFSESDSDTWFSSEDESDIEFEHARASQITQRSSVGEGTDRLYKIANEVLTTERAYVKRLHLIDQVFHFRVVLENRAHKMFPEEVIPVMFSNLKSIYQFHDNFLLPHLEKRLQEWEETPKIGDLMKKFAPFFKLYSEYVKNFDNAMNVIGMWTDKCPRFAAVIENIQAMPECGNLTLQHHMLGPIQRVPRYEMLLKDYLKHLPEDSNDIQDATDALKLVTTAASHSNDAMKKMEKFKQLLDLQEKLGGEIDLIGPTTEILKEGHVIKISARNGQHYDRYLFLFNNFLLVCQAVLIGIKQSYRIKSNMPLDGMQVLDGNDFMTPNTFCVRTQKKIIEFHTSTDDEKLEWQVALSNAVADFTKKKMTRNITDMKEFGDNELGKRAPTWVKDQETSMCMRCGSKFSVLNRRHHCRACGIVVCGKCSRHQVKLQYDDGKLNRVCDSCHEVLSAREEEEEAPAMNQDEAPGGGTDPPRSTPPPRPPLPTSSIVSTPSIKKVLKVKASDPCIISDYLHMSTDKRNWQRRFVTIHDNFVMYSYKAHHDVVAMTSLPLLSYKVTEEDGIPDRGFVFTLYHKGEKKLYYFQAETETKRKQWMSVMGSVVNAELPKGAVISRPRPSVSS